MPCKAASRGVVLGEVIRDSCPMRSHLQGQESKPRPLLQPVALCADRSPFIREDGGCGKAERSCALHGSWVVLTQVQVDSLNPRNGRCL